MSEYTKGKWAVSGKLPYIVATTAPPYRLDGTTIVSRGQETGGQDWPAIDKTEREANARLIAAAPDLLEACKNFLSRWVKSGPQGSAQWEKFDKVIRDLRAAINKAESEE